MSPAVRSATRYIAADKAFVLKYRYKVRTVAIRHWSSSGNTQWSRVTIDDEFMEESQVNK